MATLTRPAGDVQSNCLVSFLWLALTGRCGSLTAMRVPARMEPTGR
jgi:hypothetical protein